MDINELGARRMLLDWLIRELREDDDPRAPAAIEELQRQQRLINDMIIAAQAKNGEKPVAVGLKPIKLSARALGG